MISHGNNLSIHWSMHGYISSDLYMWQLDYKESWVLNNWCFWTVVLEKTLESPLDCKSILKEISPEYSSEGLMLKLKQQYYGYLMQRVDSVEKSLTLGKIEGRRRRGWLRMKWLDGITASMDVGLSKRWAIVKEGEAWHGAVREVVKIWTWLSYWTTTMWNVSVPDSSVGKKSACNAGHPGSMPGQEDLLEKG